MQPTMLSTTRNEIECDLHDNHPLRLAGVKGRRIQSVAGVVWITAYKQPADIFLKPGETYVIPNDGLLLVEAVGHSRIRVDAPRTFASAAAAMLTCLLTGMRQFSRKGAAGRV